MPYPVRRIPNRAVVTSSHGTDYEDIVSKILRSANIRRVLFMEQSETKTIPYFAHEGEMFMAERREKRFIGIIILLIVALAGVGYAKGFHHKNG